MPLRDHFRPPLDNRHRWQVFHTTWPVMMVAGLRGKLPSGFFAEPWINPGSSEAVELAVASELPGEDAYEVRIYDRRRPAHLVAVVEIVGPSNKDRPESRRAFVAKCARLLRERVSVTMVDIVTTCTTNLYAELLALLGQSDPDVGSEPLYTLACRMTRRGEDCQLEAWSQSLSLQEPLPTMPLWLADNLAIPLDLEKSYEESCNGLGIA